MTWNDVMCKRGIDTVRYLIPEDVFRSSRQILLPLLPPSYNLSTVPLFCVHFLCVDISQVKTRFFVYFTTNENNTKLQTSCFVLLVFPLQRSFLLTLSNFLFIIQSATHMFAARTYFFPVLGNGNILKYLSVSSQGRINKNKSLIYTVISQL